MRPYERQSPATSRLLKKLLRDICAVLGLEFEELYAVQVEEKLESEFPKALAKLAKRDPRILPSKSVGGCFSDDEKEHIILLAKSYASENLLKKKSSAGSYQSRFEITKPPNPTRPMTF